MALLESQKEKNSHLQLMKLKLHDKGAALTSSWSDLFCFLSRYQAELTLKENALEIAEREIDMRKTQLKEIQPMLLSSSDKVSKLQDDIGAKDWQIYDLQSKLLLKEHTVETLQLDLASNRELLDKSRNDFFEEHNKLFNYIGKFDKLQSELSVKQEQILIHDSQLMKLQDQFTRENADLKEQLTLARKTLEVKHQSHELTKNRCKVKSELRISNFATQDDHQDSSSTFDLSTEDSDFDTPSMFTTTVHMPMEEDDDSCTNIMQRKPSPAGKNGSIMSSSPILSSSPVISRLASDLTDTVKENSIQQTPSQHSKVGDAGDIYFPLKIKQEIEGAINDIDAGDIYFPLKIKQEIEGAINDIDAGDIYFPLKIKQENEGAINDISDEQSYSGMSSSRLDDPNLTLNGQVPINGPISHSNQDRTFGDEARLLSGANQNKLPDDSNLCPICGRLSDNIEAHLKSHWWDSLKRPFECPQCKKTFKKKVHLTVHQRIHSGEKPYGCDICGRRFSQANNVRRHKFIHINK